MAHSNANPFNITEPIADYAAQTTYNERRRSLLIQHGRNHMIETHGTSKTITPNNEILSEVSEISLETFLNETNTGCTPKERFCITDTSEDADAVFVRIQQKADGISGVPYHAKVSAAEEMMKQFDAAFFQPQNLAVRQSPGDPNLDTEPKLEAKAANMPNAVEPTS